MTAAVATTMVTTMTEPMLPTAAERLAALRAPSKKRSRPANTSKILSAGLSTTAMFGLVTAMGWSSGAGSVQATAAPVAPIIQGAAAAAAPTVAAPTAVVSAAPVEPTVAPLVPVAPAQPAVPAPAAPVVVPVVIPVAVPVAQPRVQAAASNTTTSASG